MIEVLTVLMGSSIKDVHKNTVRVPMPPGKSWIFFPENSRTWKVLENHFGPGKSWKLKLKVLKVLEKYP